MRTRDYVFTEAHLEFARTPAQKEALELVLKGHTNEVIAKKLKIEVRNLYGRLERIKANAKRYGLDANHDLTKPQALPLSGASTLYTPNEETGELELRAQWVKTNKTAEQMIRDAELIIAEMSKTVPALKKTTLSKAVSKTLDPKLANLHILTDFHFGMFSWAPETLDENWDTEIAEGFLIEWFKAALMLAPPAKVGILSQLGDFLHADGILPLTPSSGHVLDADSRYDKVVQIAIRSLETLVGMMLQKYEVVHLINSPGNHDPAGSSWLRHAMAMRYRDEPRVVIDISPSVYHAFEHGKTSLFFHHGHKKPVKAVDVVFTGMFAEMYGRTKYRYAHLGHKHSKEQYESNLMLVTQHATMAPKDAFAAQGGWLSQRSADVITYHEDFGDVGAVRVNPEMVRSILA